MDNKKLSQEAGRLNIIVKWKEKNAIRESKRKYMVNKEWICIVCDNHNYTLSGKCKHLRTKKHIKNKTAYDVMNKIIDIIHKK